MSVFRRCTVRNWTAKLSAKLTTMPVRFQSDSSDLLHEVGRISDTNPYSRFWDKTLEEIKIINEANAKDSKVLQQWLNTPNGSCVTLTGTLCRKDYEDCCSKTCSRLCTGSNPLPGCLCGTKCKLFCKAWYLIVTSMTPDTYKGEHTNCFRSDDFTITMSTGEDAQVQFKDDQLLEQWKTMPFRKALTVTIDDLLPGSVAVISSFSVA